MSNKIFSRDGLFRPRYTFLVAGGDLMIEFGIWVIRVSDNFIRSGHTLVFFEWKKWTRRKMRRDEYDTVIKCDHSYNR